MKNTQKGSSKPLSFLLILLALFIVVIIAHVYMPGHFWNVLSGQNTQQNQTSSTTTTVTQPETYGVNGVEKYNDPSLDFSFWYPTGWSVKRAPISNPKKYLDGIISKELLVSDGQRVITLEVYTSPTFSITDSSGVGACPVCDPTHYYFDTAHKNTLMVEYPQGTSSGASGSSTPVLVGTTPQTMDGLYMLAGSHRFGGNKIIPLSYNIFIIVTVDGALATESPHSEALAETVTYTGSYSGAASPFPRHTDRDRVIKIFEGEVAAYSNK